jgi:hypothetical protein
MKLIIITIIDELKKDVIKLFKTAEIENFSESDIDGFKTSISSQLATGWFGGKSYSADSEMFFSFENDEKVKYLFKLIKNYNKTIEHNNPIRAVILPVEDYV